AGAFKAASWHRKKFRAGLTQPPRPRQPLGQSTGLIACFDNPYRRRRVSTRRAPGGFLVSASDRHHSRMELSLDQRGGRAEAIKTFSRWTSRPAHLEE